MQQSKIKKYIYLIFLNNWRGLNIVKLFVRHKLDFAVVLTKKNLNKNIIQHLKNLNVKYDLIENMQNFEKKINLKYDIFIVAGFPHIFKKSILNIPKFGCINLHAGPLPKYRGGSPLNWQIINNEKKLGISIIKMNEKIDGGKILIKKFFSLNKNQNIYHAHKKANILFKNFIFKSINNLIKKKYKKKIGKEIYFRQRKEEDSLVSFKTMTANQIINLSRSLIPLYPPPYFFIEKGRKIYFKKAYIEKKLNAKKYFYFFKCKRNYIGIKKCDLI
jgi:methionyl-tRNA formyltransferase